jgi:hypothetical protein
MFKTCFKSHRVKNLDGDGEDNESDKKLTQPINMAMRFGHTHRMASITDIIH